MTQAARFRELLRLDGMIVAAGAYDCIIARMIGRARSECVAKAPRPKGFASNSAAPVKVRSGSNLPVPG